MPRFLTNFPRRLSTTRWAVLAILAALCVQSVVVPIELFHNYHVALYSSHACLLVGGRETDIFVTKVILPYPLLMLVVVLPPFIGWCLHQPEGRAADAEVPDNPPLERTGG